MRRQVLKAMALAVVAAFATQAGAQVPDRIRMGMIGSMTGPGAATDFSVIKGVQLAVQEINKAGGIAGKQIDLVIGDSQADPTTSVNEVRRLVGPERVHVLIGPFSSQLTLAVAPVLNQARLASISTSGSTELTPEKSLYHFSIIPPADVQAFVMVDHAVDVLKAKSVAMIGDNGAQSKAAAAAAEAQAKRRGIQWLGYQEHQFRAADVTPQMLNLRRANPDVLLMWPNTGEDHAQIVKARDEIGWKVPTVNGGGTALNVAPAKKVYARAYEGIPSTMLRSWTYCEGDAVGAGELVKFKDRMRAYAGNDYARIAANYSAWTYDAVYAFKAAIEEAKTVDGPRLTAWFEENSPKIKAVSGSLKASKQSHFLFGDPKAIVMVVDTDKPRSDGYYRRITGC